MNPLQRLAACFQLTAMVAAMIVWALHFVVVYAVVGLHCDRPLTLARQPAGLWLLLSTLLALAVAVAIGIAAWRRWRRASRTASARERFMSIVTGTLALIALLAIGMTALPMLLQPSCLGWGAHGH